MNILKPSYPIGKYVKWYNQLEKDFGIFLKVECDPEIPLLSLQLRELTMHVKAESCSQMFVPCYSY